MNKARLLILALVCSIQASGQSGDYIFEQISPDAGFTFSAISCIVEDRYGFIWFGGKNGLYYYNTSDIIKYNSDPNNENSPPSNNIWALYRDWEDKIWVCTNNGLCYFNEAKNAFTEVTINVGNSHREKTRVRSILQVGESKYLTLINSDLYQFDPNELVFEKVNLDFPTSEIYCLGITENDQVYFGTTTGKVYLSEGEGSELDFRLFYSSPSESGTVSTLCFADSHCWIGFLNEGVVVVDGDGLLKSRYREEYSGDNHLPSNAVNKIVQRKNGDIWVGTLGGILTVNSETNHIIKPELGKGLPHRGIFELYPDRNEGIWIGTWAGGLTYYHDDYYKFSHIQKIVNDAPLSGDVISSFAEDKNGTVWVGSENNGLIPFDPVRMEYMEKASTTNRWPISRIKSMATDPYNRQWFGTFREGLWVMENTTITRVGDLNGIFSSILALDDGIWIGDRAGGLVYFDFSENSYTRYVEENIIGSISSNQVMNVFQDSQGNLWVCSDFGLSVMRNREEGFQRYFYNGTPEGLGRNMNYTITEDRYGKLWIGTSGGGIDIYDPETDAFSKFKLNEAIESADVYCILRDHLDNMWFSSNQGIYVYSSHSNTLKRFTQEDGLLGLQYHPNSGFVCSSGMLYFGGSNGFNVIDPGAVKQNEIVPTAYLSKVLVNNKTIEELEPKYLNSRFPASIERLELNYNQNSITVGLVGNSAIKSFKNKFRYRIENYQDEWIEIVQGTDASFTKIPPGEYVLEVLASNSDALWNELPTKIQIKIHPPFWSSWYSWVFYVALFLSALYGIVKGQQFRAKSKADEELFSEKVRFFTNISHEFRTPLTLILSPLNSLIRKVSYDPDMSDQVNTVKRNADRLLRLTNQLLDFRVIELNKSKLKTEPKDVVAICRSVYDCFEFQVAEKKINMIFNSAFKTLVLPVDEEKIDKVIYNLLSNALKYSPEKAQIILSLEQKILDQSSYDNVFFLGNQFYGKSLELKVRDNGKGINPETIPQIFDRFFADHSDGETGTGIGLHICQEYARLHKGHIMVTSEPDMGSTFILNIPMAGRGDYEKENLIVQTYFDPLPETESKELSNSEGIRTDKIVLYAEDNDEMRIYLKKLLATRYKVLTAKNGKQAFEIASEVIPDLIITDVLMPGMGGMELTQLIRQTDETNDIPIIILTALSEDHHKVESMEKGAHTFITKPVDESFLLAKIENIFRERDALKKKYGEAKVESKLLPGSKISFVARAEEIVENNLRNPSFEIGEFASQLSISKSSLQRKIKSATNLNPSEFIRDYRLKKAVELLKQDNLNVDEIALLVGFNSTSYFIRTFKNKYGKTPTAFKAEQSGH